jgi:TonB family protein
MYNSTKLTGAALVGLALTISVAAQRPRSTAADSPTTANKSTPAPKPSPAPQSVKAKYEGGVFGYNKKQEGTLSFDDANERLVFRNQQQKEVMFIPYAAISQEFADTQSRKPKSASILGSVPVPYGINPIGFIKTKVRYVTLQFYDPDSHMGGVTSFRVENRDLCESVVATLADKAGLVAQGEIFVRQRPASSGMTARVDDPIGRPAVSVENETLSARIISLPRPIYPEEARSTKVSGMVRVLVTVDEQGNVVEAEAISGSPLLQSAAVDAAKQAKFEPLLNGGRPVKSKSVISYNFQAP